MPKKTKDDLTLPLFGPRGPRTPRTPREPAKARHTDPVTSHEAAATVDLSEQKQAVLACLKTYPAGATSYRVAERMKRPLVCISPTFARLRESGLARESGRYERGESGRRRIVWIAV